MYISHNCLRRREAGLRCFAQGMRKPQILKKSPKYVTKKILIESQTYYTMHIVSKRS